MQDTLVKELMTLRPVIVSPDASLKEAARLMDEVDCGILPVGNESNFEGILTDRDIVVRAVAWGKDITKEKVRDYMSPRVFFCEETDTLKQAADKMRDHQVSRLIVRDANKKPRGILTFGCILRKTSDIGEISDAVEHAVGRKAA